METIVGFVLWFLGFFLPATISVSTQSILDAIAEVLGGISA